MGPSAACKPAHFREHFARYRFAIYSGKQTPWLFHHTISRRHNRAGERIRSLYGAFKAATKRAKLSTDSVQHELRQRLYRRP